MEGQNFPHLNIQTDMTLEDLDFDQIRRERFDRNRQFLECVDPVAAARVFPHAEHEHHLSRREEAAVTIQRCWRGYQGRQLYVAALWNKFEKEEERQQEKIRYQMEEGELLVENHQLEVLFEDGKTTRRNAARRYISKVIIIQRAWRNYLDKKALASLESSLRDQGSKHGNLKIEHRKVRRWNPFTNEDNEEQCVDIDADLEDTGKIVDPSDEAACLLNPVSKREGKTSEQNSELLNVSDWSPRQQRKHSLLSQAQKFVDLKKLDSKVLPFDLHLHLDQTDCQDTHIMSQTMAPSSESAHIQQCSSIKGGNSKYGDEESKEGNSSEICEGNVDGSMICDKKNESQSSCDISTKVDSEENYCDKNSLTQGDNSNSKQVDIGVNSNISTQKEISSEQTDRKEEKCSENEEEMNAFDVYNIETALPNMDWKSLEAKLKAASEEARLIQEARRNDREEIRKKLAMGAEDDGLDDDDDDDDITYKKTKLQSRLHSGLQICFMNESPGDTDNEGMSPRQHEIHDNAKLLKKVSNLVDSDNNLSTVTDLNNPTPPSTSIQNASPPRLKPEKGEKAEDFHSRQEQLQNEAKLALAQAGSMAHMQLEIEKQLKKKSPMAEMVGIPGLGEKHRKKLSLRQLQQMNLASIQVLYNDFQTQIESLNEELVHLLMERDELHMEQDSMLVDIEDLTRRAEELAKHANLTGGNKGSKTNGSVKGKLPAR